MDINGGDKNRVFLHDLMKITEGTVSEGTIFMHIKFNDCCFHYNTSWTSKLLIGFLNLIAIWFFFRITKPSSNPDYLAFSPLCHNRKWHGAVQRICVQYIVRTFIHTFFIQNTTLTLETVAAAIWISTFWKGIGKEILWKMKGRMNKCNQMHTMGWKTLQIIILIGYNKNAYSKRISTDYEMLAQPCKSRQNSRSIHHITFCPWW